MSEWLPYLPGFGMALGALLTSVGMLVRQTRLNDHELGVDRALLRELEERADLIAANARRELGMHRPTRRGSRRRLLAAYARLMVQQAVDDITGAAPQEQRPAGRELTWRPRAGACPSCGAAPAAFCASSCTMLDASDWR